MQRVTMEKAAETLPDLLREVSEGTDVVITRDGEPIARLTPATFKRPRRKCGSAAGEITMSDHFESRLKRPRITRSDGVAGYAYLRIIRGR